MPRTPEKRERHRIYMRDRYRDDPEYRERHKEIVRRSKARLRQRGRDAIAAAKGEGCRDCGATEGLEFHHRDPATKLFDVANWMKVGKGFDALVAEIEKCDALCGPCHRKAHGKAG